VDIYQRLNYDRVLLLGQFIDDSAANQIMSVLMYLHKEDKKAPIYMLVHNHYDYYYDYDYLFLVLDWSHLDPTSARPALRLDTLSYQM